MPRLRKNTLLKVCFGVPMLVLFMYYVRLYHTSMSKLKLYNIRNSEDGAQSAANNDQAGIDINIPAISPTQLPQDEFPPTPSTPPPLQIQEVKHLWIFPQNDTRFVVFDTYAVKLPRSFDPNVHDFTDVLTDSMDKTLEDYLLILADGVIKGMKFPTDQTHSTDLECVWQIQSGEQSTKPKIRFMRFRGGIRYQNHENARSPFSLNNAYMTHYIMCGLPTGNLEGLILKQIKSPGNNWWVDLNILWTNLQNRQFPPPGRITVCLAPVYGPSNVRWMVEWLEFHRAMGVHHVQIPLFDDEKQHKPLWELLRWYQKQGFVTVHHWSARETSGLTKNDMMYERGKYLAWDDCYLRNRGVSNWALFVDIDETGFSTSGSFNQSLDFCDDVFNKTRKVACSLQSHTVTSVYKVVKPFVESNKLLMEEYDYGEATTTGRCPHACGRYNRGRWKFIARTREEWLPPIMMWTHAIDGQEYDYADKIMAELPRDLLIVHHYQGWWYYQEGTVKLVPEALVKGGHPVPPKVITDMRNALDTSPELKKMYVNSPGKLGLSWIEAQV